MVLVYDMSSECALQFFLKFRRNISNVFQVIERMTDKRMF